MKIFGTDGIRGYAWGGDGIILSPDFCTKVGYAIARAMEEENWAVVWDTRATSPHIVFSLSSAMAWLCKKVHLIGVLPTPSCAVFSRTLRWGAIAVSASHNPPEFNGIKIFSSDGMKISESKEAEIEKLFETDMEAKINEHPPTPENSEHLRAVYTSYIKQLFPKGFLKGVRIVLDCSNGATYKVAPEIFDYFGAKLKVIGNIPDGKNINVGVGSENPQTALREEGDFKVIFDGDGDRVLLGDAKGKLFDGDHNLSILARVWAKNEKLRWGVVGTVMSNLALERFVRSLGYNFERVPVGDRNVSYRMRELGANLGGEESGHTVIFDYLTTGDGIITALEVLKCAMEEGKELEELAIEKFPQVKLKIKVSRKVPVSVPEDIKRTLEKEGVRAVVRYSGTEPVLRIMTEAEDEEKAKRYALILKEKLEKELEKAGALAQ